MLCRGINRHTVCPSLHYQEHLHSLGDEGITYMVFSESANTDTAGRNSMPMTVMVRHIVEMEALASSGNLLNPDAPYTNSDSRTLGSREGSKGPVNNCYWYRAFQVACPLPEHAFDLGLTNKYMRTLHSQVLIFTVCSLIGHPRIRKWTWAVGTLVTQSW